MVLRSKLDPQKSADEIGEMIDDLGKLVDRVKVLYEQFFMGIQRMPPAQLHRDIERRIRELTQEQIRNTGLRFRFATLTQKFGSYNTYWRRTMRKIERGEYIRDIAKVGRRAAERGEDVPEELLSKVPKRMRDRIMRDRARVAARAAKSDATKSDAAKSDAAKSDARSDAAKSDAKRSDAAAADAPAKVRAPKSNAVVLDDDVDMDSIFASLVDETPGTTRAIFDDEDTGRFTNAGGHGQTRPGFAPAAESSPPLPPRPPPREPPGQVARISSSARAPTAGGAHPRTVARRAQTDAGGNRIAPPIGMSEREGRALFEQYAKARKLVGDRRPVTYDQLMTKLSTQAPKIMRDHNAAGVGFSVVIKGDKVILKAKPKKG